MKFIYNALYWLYDGTTFPNSYGFNGSGFPKPANGVCSIELRSFSIFLTIGLPAFDKELNIFLCSISYYKFHISAGLILVTLPAFISSPLFFILSEIPFYKLLQ